MKTPELYLFLLRCYKEQKSLLILEAYGLLVPNTASQQGCESL